MGLTPFIILFVSGIILTVGDLVFKNWVKKGMGYSILYVFGVLVYVFGTLLLVESYKYDVNIGIAGVVQDLFNTVILIIFAYYYFHEPLTKKQLLGIALGMVALFLIG